LRRSAAGAGGGALAAGLADLQRLMALEQRDLRYFIRELQPPAEASPGAPFDLEARLADLRQRLELEWGLAIELRTRGLERSLPASLAREIYHMTREALINAVRHGQASRVSLEIDLRERQRILLSVADNGRGFPFEGRFTERELAERGLGPRTLRERVAALAGSLDLESTAAGARLEIRLPVPEAA
jgi:signal transduction histidine kinase